MIAEELDDRVDTLTRGMLALTVSCARCHDHKFDPIPTQDYYSLAGVFHSSRLTDLPVASPVISQRYQTALRESQAADKTLKDFATAQRRRISEERAGKLADHLVAAWKKRTGDKSLAPGLDSAFVDSCSRLIAPGSGVGKGVAELETLRKSSRNNLASQGDVEKAAAALQARMTKKGGRNEDKAMKNVLFGDKVALTPSEAELPKLLTGDPKQRFEALRAKMAETKQAVPPAPPMVHALTEDGAKDLKVYLRGNPATPGEIAPRRFLKIVSGDAPPAFNKGSGRLELAAAMSAADNPLTARVIVNRLWQHHFGRGIVGTPSNFGQLGERPTHPELLDWLADELVRSGWSLKHIHRLIVTSATYRQSSIASGDNIVKDPDNRWLWRMNRRRLDVESYRDTLLSAAGELDVRKVAATPELRAANNKYRTVYARVSRHDLDGLLRLFDFPDANITSEKRTETTVPQQQLFVMNSPFVIGRAQELAARVTKEGPQERVGRIYSLVYGRNPSEAEKRLADLYLSLPDDANEKSGNKLTRRERYARSASGEQRLMYVD